MLQADEIIFIVFKFINFFILIFIFYYLYKKYIFFGLKSSVERQVGSVRSLKELINSKKSHIDYLGKDYLLQENSIDDLNAKLSLWSRSCLEDKDKQELLIQEVQKELNDKRIIQQENFGRLQLNSIVIPQAIERAEIELKKKFEDDQKAALKYIKDIVNFMAEG